VLKVASARADQGADATWQSCAVLLEAALPAARPSSAGAVRAAARWEAGKVLLRTELVPA